MLEQLGRGFRELPAALCVVGALVTFYTLAFADIPLNQFGKPKPPLRVFVAGLPGVIWGITRATQNKQQTPWE